MRGPVRLIFLSHGAPTLVIEDVPARRFLEELGASMPHPRAVLVASAHWETKVPTVNAVGVNDTIHDFRGFPRELYEMRYPAPGSPLVAGEVVDLLNREGLEAAVDEKRGLDHGAWVPLMLMWPDAHIPVLQLSVQPEHGPEHHYRMGQALEPLTREDVLILGSGSFTHDLSTLRLGSGQGIEAEQEPNGCGASPNGWTRRSSRTASAT